MRLLWLVKPWSREGHCECTKVLENCAPVVVLAFSSSTWETEAGGCKFEANLIYTRLYNSETVSEKEGGAKKSTQLRLPSLLTSENITSSWVSFEL